MRGGVLGAEVEHPAVAGVHMLLEVGRRIGIYGEGVFGLEGEGQGGAPGARNMGRSLALGTPDHES